MKKGFFQIAAAVFVASVFLGGFLIKSIQINNSKGEDNVPIAPGNNKTSCEKKDDGTPTGNFWCAGCGGFCLSGSYTGGGCNNAQEAKCGEIPTTGASCSNTKGGVFQFQCACRLPGGRVDTVYFDRSGECNPPDGLGLCRVYQNAGYVCGGDAGNGYDPGDGTNICWQWSDNGVVIKSIGNCRQKCDAHKHTCNYNTNTSGGCNTANPAIGESQTFNGKCGQTQQIDIVCNGSNYLEHRSKVYPDCPTNTPKPTRSPSPSPKPTKTPAPTKTPVITITPTSTPTPTATATLTATITPSPKPQEAKLTICKYKDENGNGYKDSEDKLISWRFSYNDGDGQVFVESAWWNFWKKGCVTKSVDPARQVVVNEEAKNGWELTGIYGDGIKVVGGNYVYNSEAGKTKEIWFLNKVNPSATPVPGEPNSCNGTCGSNYNCQGGLYCYKGYCRNPQNPESSTCEEPEVMGATAPPVLPKTGNNIIINLFGMASVAGAGLYLYKKFKLI